MLNFLKNSFLNEYQRWVLWLPAFQACGILTYFSLPTEPAFYEATGALAAGLAAGVVWAREAKLAAQRATAKPMVDRRFIQESPQRKDASALSSRGEACSASPRV